VFTILVAGCMMLAGNAAFERHWSFTDPAEMGLQLGGVFGPLVKNAMLLLMINAAVLGTTTISLSSAWAYGEVRGWSHSLQKPVREAPGFYGLYVLCVLAAAAVVLIPRAPLQLIILSVQVLAGLMLPSAIVFLQLLLNDRELLGERFVNRRWNNAVNWSIVGVLFVLSMLLAAQVAAPGLFPAE
jgi:Mn2+/Fe2+ NRAMP family transporter